MAERNEPNTEYVPPSAVKDGAAFRHLFEHYAPRLRTYFTRRGAPPALSEELIQEVMLTVWNKSELFDPSRAALSTWIYTIARNKHLDRLRRMRPEPDPEDPCWLGDRPEQTRPPDFNAAANQSRARLRRAVDSLPEELRQLLFALYYEGKSMSEVAAETHVPLGTVKTRARRALAALRKHLDDTEP